MIKPLLASLLRAVASTALGACMAILTTFFVILIQNPAIVSSGTIARYFDLPLQVGAVTGLCVFLIFGTTRR